MTSNKKAALDGIKIADFSWFAAGPLTTRLLSDFGATVVKIETAQLPDGLRTTPPYKDAVPGLNRSAYYANYNANKLSIAVNLRHPEGKQVAERLVKWADVVVENFTPGVIDRLGLGYDQLKEIKPDIIMLSTSNQGQTGPYANLSGMGTQLTSFAGISSITGWADRTPTAPYGAYTDITAAVSGAIAVTVALDYRRRTGKGQYLDVSQLESGVALLGPSLLDYMVNERSTYRAGNRDPYAAPHGVFPCIGDEKWCAIAVFTDDEWESLCRVMGNPAWSSEPKFGTGASRKENEDELEALLGEWTAKYDAAELAATLQSAGVAAGPALNAEDIYRDPQLVHRHHFWELEHPEMGKYHCDAPPFHLSATPSEERLPAPCLGEQTDYVCSEILGYSDEEFIQLLASGALAPS